MYKIISAGCLSLLITAIVSLSPLPVQANSKGLIREAAQHQKSKNVAIVVGVEQYDEASSGLSRLNYAADDAVKLATVFQQNRYVVKRLVDHQAGKHQILAAIRSAGQLIDPQNSTLVFSFSGHGFAAKNGRNYLMTAGSTTANLQASALGLDEVINALRGSRAKRILIFIDACREVPGSKSLSKGFRPQQGQGVQILLSTGFNALSWESPKLQQGVFSHFLVKGLQGAASRGDGIVEFNELAQYVEGHVKDWTFQNMNRLQQPFHRSHGELFGRFVVTAKGRFGGDGEQERQRRQREQQLAQQRLQQQRQRDQQLTQQRLQQERQREQQVAVEQRRRQQLAQQQAIAQRQRQQQVIQPRPASNTRQWFEPEMVKIPGKNYEMGKYEVTFKQWDACVNAGGCKHKPSDEGWGRDNRPVINVSWDDAQVYIKWLNKETGKRYRLPTEQEWEHAARAGSSTDYPWGDAISCSVAQYRHNSSDGESCHGGKTVQVGRFPANRWGLHDTVGNVSELAVPEDDGAYRAQRGGSWLDDLFYARSAHSSIFSANFVRDYSVGFRLIRVPGR